MLDFKNMITNDNRLHIYGGCHADLILGGGVSISYRQFRETVMPLSVYHESATINLMELSAIEMALKFVPNDFDYTVHTASRYVATVIQNIGKWRNQNILEEKAHSHILKKLLESLERLGEGQLSVYSHSFGRETLLGHLGKYAKHAYYQIQLEMIKNKTTALTQDQITQIGEWNLNDLPGSIIWKTPMPMSVFEKKMIKARSTENPVLRLVDQLPDANPWAI